MVKKPKVVKPRTRPVKKKVMPVPADGMLSGAGNASENRSQTFSNTGPQEGGTVAEEGGRNQENDIHDRIKPKKKTKKDVSLNDAAQGSLMAQSGARAEDKKGKSSTLTCIFSQAFD
jgi:hypothetical protein